MATRRIHFFMRPAEFSALICEAADKFGLYVIRWGFGRDRRLELAESQNPIVMSDGTPAQRVFLATEQPDPALIDPAHLRPGEWGWIDSDVPREEEDILYIAQMAAKSDWYDAEREQIMENPASLALFRRIVPAFRRRLKRPVWAYSIQGGQPVAYRDIGYSQGAEEWCRRGGQLRQLGVANVRFTIGEPTTSTA